MHRNTRLLTLLIAAAPVLGACDDSSLGPDPALGFEDATIVMDAELEIAIDNELTAAAVEGVEIALGPNRGPGPRARIQNARDHFANARRRYNAGDGAGARAAGRQARESLSDALLEGRGSSEVDVMIEELESVIATLSVDASVYADAPALSVTLAGLVDAAKTDRKNGQDRKAGEKVVRGRQHTDRARRDGVTDRPNDRPNDILTRDILARLQVEQGGKAEVLATGLIGSNPTEAQQRLMETASELLDKAHGALAEGKLARAASLAHSAEVKFLQAVIATDLAHADVQTIKGLAGQLLEEARVVVGQGASAVDLAIFEVAARLYQGGCEKLEAGNARGLLLLWHSATMSAVLIG